LYRHVVIFVALVVCGLFGFVIIVLGRRQKHCGYKIKSYCEYQNIMSHISINLDNILFEVIKIYQKGGVVFMDFVKESLSCDKSLPRFLGSGHCQILEETR
jgi:hypothetical protein